ncbi:hypothetical protein MFMK1_000065 [Metallumcola ferriviriculae]|uniref:Uncharacterized protein n=1 Tax=Metallumcola ferriviriculae TaxID=3039180 RepID=A0AAU0UM95_9FIRM|nr:hypothetical protein MFMK1_000065 [Desulfitibacteraceae bacterium MK1]
MYVVAVKDTSEWYYCKTDVDAAKKVTELLERFPKERIILAEEFELTVIKGEVEVMDVDEEDDHNHDDCDCDH